MAKAISACLIRAAPCDRVLFWVRLGFLFLATGLWNAQANCKKSSNASRDVGRALAKDSKYPMVYVAKCKYWNHEADASFEDDTHFMLPYELMDVLIEEEATDWTNVDPSDALYAQRRNWGQKLDPIMEESFGQG